MPTTSTNMSQAPTPDGTPSMPHPADRHDLIRVHGARVNNLRDVSIEIPKRRLTVFTGVSGSGKSTFIRCINRLEPTFHRAEENNISTC